MITRIGVVLWLLGNPVMGGSKVHLQVVGDWGASKADVEKVLQSAAVPLWRMFPDRDLSVIKVEPQGGPIVLFGRGSEGEYRMRLNTGGTYWSQYAYAQNYIDQAEVPADMAGWYRRHAEHFTKNATDRSKNRVVAVKLLPMFERDPSLWQAVAYLNLGEDRKERDFRRHMKAWYEHAPRKFGPQILEIASMLGVAAK